MPQYAYFIYRKSHLNEELSSVISKVGDSLMCAPPFTRLILEELLMRIKKEVVNLKYG